VTWLNYEPPNFDLTPKMPPAAAKQEEGAQRLASFVNGIDAIPNRGSAT
jgi:hypothetical protein